MTLRLFRTLLSCPMVREVLPVGPVNPSAARDGSPSAETLSGRAMTSGRGGRLDDILETLAEYYQRITGPGTPAR